MLSLMTIIYISKLTASITGSKMPDWQKFDSILAPMASIYPLSIAGPETKLVLPFMKFLLAGRRVVGSTVPPKIAYMQMLRFAALHGIKPMTERFPMTGEGVTDSLKKVNQGKMRYRGVLYAEDQM